MTKKANPGGLGRRRMTEALRNNMDKTMVASEKERLAMDPTYRTTDGWEKDR